MTAKSDGIIGENAGQCKPKNSRPGIRVAGRMPPERAAGFAEDRVPRIRRNRSFPGLTEKDAPRDGTALTGILNEAIMK